MTVRSDPLQLAAPQERPQLIDPFGRAISYVRISVTDRCDFRCVYCMAEDMSFLPKKDLLSLEETRPAGPARSRRSERAAFG